MKVLVTGGAGFIGSHIVDAYLAAGWDVAVVDNLATGARANLNPRARFYEADIRDAALREVFERERPEVVNHHAAQSSVVVSVRDPRQDAHVNVHGSINLFTLCREFGVGRVVYASTGGALYGTPERIPAGEDHPIRPLAPYGVSKFSAEHYLRVLAASEMTWAVLRYANVYGPRQDPLGEAGVVAIFTGAMLDGRAPTIFGDGTQTRDFVYVGDVAYANLLASDVPASGIANIGTGQETTVNDIFHHLAEAIGFRSPPHYAPARAGEMYRIALDATAALRWLGWSPSTPLVEGLRRTAAWFKEEAHGAKH